MQILVNNIGRIITWLLSVLPSATAPYFRTLKILGSPPLVSSIHHTSKNIKKRILPEQNIMNPINCLPLLSSLCSFVYLLLKMDSGILRFSIHIWYKIHVNIHICFLYVVMVLNFFSFFWRHKWKYIWFFSFCGWY